MKVARNVLVFCALVAAVAVASDTETVQGTWKVVAAIRDGKPLTGAELEGRLTIEGNRFTVVQGGTTVAGTFQLNESAKPKELDLTYDQGPDSGKTAHGIYEIRAGNRHRLCIAPAGAARPTKFESRPGSGHLFEEWVRAK
jgi:uncharacterized protein (TIGR03067 family)